MSIEISKRIEAILAKLNEGIYEKEEVIALSLLGALSGANTFLLGPPGTAKSLIARRIASVFETSHYFELLMNKFSTPEEVFGPIKLSELKKDNYERNIEGYLPTADVAFLDEVWKSNAAILNALLTIVNEKLFKNGGKVEGVPLKALISASNETPPANQGLEAIYDRFLIRLFVAPTESVDNFNRILQDEETSAISKIDDKITNDELELWQLEIDEIVLSKDVLNIIKSIRIKINAINKKSKKEHIYISDRRWKKAARLLKASAFFSGRKKTTIVDALLLRHCLWSNSLEREKVFKVVEDAVKENGVQTTRDISDIERKKDALGKEVQEDLFHSDDVYKKITLNGKKYFRAKFPGTSINFYIPISMRGKNEEFTPLDESGSKIKRLSLNFFGSNSSFRCVSFTYVGDKKESTINLEMDVSKGDVKQGVSERVFSGIQKELQRLEIQIEVTTDEIKERRVSLMNEMRSAFISEDMTSIALEGIDQQISDISVLKTEFEQIQQKFTKAKNHQK